MNAVFDTNVFVAAFAAEGLCATLLRRARRREFQLILCPAILRELQRTLRDKFGATADEVRNALALIREAVDSTLTDPADIPPTAGDRSDDAVLACALAGRAEFLVTGDDDLLTLKTFRGIHIIRPRDFETLFVG